MRMCREEVVEEGEPSGTWRWMESANFSIFCCYLVVRGGLSVLRVVQGFCSNEMGDEMMRKECENHLRRVFCAEASSHAITYLLD